MSSFWFEERKKKQSNQYSVGAKEPFVPGQARHFEYSFIQMYTSRRR